MRRVVFCLLLSLVCAAVPVKPDVRLSFFEAERTGEDVVLRWQTEAEQGARDFELYRMVALPAHGSGKLYLWKEHRTSSGEEESEGGSVGAEYRLEVVLQNGGRQVLLTGAGRSGLALRRAWSSIKAMFQ